MSIKRIVIAAVILLLTAVSVGAQAPQSPEDFRRTPTRARYIFPVAPRAGVVRAAPPNDNFANATVVNSTLPYTDTVADFDQATGEVGEGQGECATNGIVSVWYSYTPDAGTTAITIDTFGSSFDTVLAVYEGSSVDALAELRCNDNFDVVDHGGYTSTIVSQSVTFGTTYMIRVTANDVENLLEGDSVTLNVKKTPVAGHFTVNSAADAADTGIGDGICDAFGVGCTLRAAINEANASQPGSEILLPAGVYTSSIDAPLDPGSLIGDQLFEDASINGDFDIVATVTITGAGPQSTIIDGADLENVFEFHADANVVINGVQVRNGSRYGGAGGGLRLNDAASVIANNVWVNGNEASFGGGVTVEGGSLTMTDSAITNNAATGFTKIDLPNPTFYLSGNGGGLEVRDRFANTVTINLTNVTISGNTAMTPDASLNYCRPTDENPNQEDPHGGKGGAVYFGFAQNTLSVAFNNVTIANNTAFCGGGIFTSTGVNVATRNTLIGDNVATSNNNPDCKGNIGSGGSNVIENTTGCDTVSGDIVNQDVRLNPLYLNAPGNTPTHLLRAASPARNTGQVATCAPADQRGISRTAHGACDIGALEALSVVPGAFALISPAHNFVVPSATSLTQFTWQPSVNAYSYAITLDSLVNGTSTNVYTTAVTAAAACSISECTASFANPLPDGFYRYTVTAYADTNATAAVNSHTVQVDSVSGLPNLLTNGGFETKSVNGQALKWNAKGISGDKRKCNTDTVTYSYKESCAYRFKGTKLENSSIRQRLDLNGLVMEKNKSFRFSFYANYSASIKATVTMKVVYKKTSITPSKFKLVLPAGDQTWMPLSGEVLLKNPKVDRVILILKHTAKSGTWLVDDVRAVYLSGTTTARQDAASTRDAQTGGLLPPPAAPDGFRGNN
jgi:CSLREA domain-containing protein